MSLGSRAGYCNPTLGRLEKCLNVLFDTGSRSNGREGEADLDLFSVVGRWFLGGVGPEPTKRMFPTPRVRVRMIRGEMG